MPQVQIDGGTQIRPGTVTGDRLAPGAVGDGQLSSTYLKADGSQPFTGDVSADEHRITDLAGPQESGDAVNRAYLDSTYPSYSHYLSSAVDLTLPLPADPVEHQMEVFEVHATARILVSVPTTVRLTPGNYRTTTVEAARTGFYGLRWSSHAGAWFLLSTAIES